MLGALFDHLVWADERALEAVRAMPANAPETECAHVIYAHLAGSMHVWLSRIEGRTPTHVVWPSLPLDEAATLARETSAALRKIAVTLDANELAREITYHLSNGTPMISNVGDILAHVALHGSYHRGQLAMLARQSGAAPASTDYIAFAFSHPHSNARR